MHKGLKLALAGIAIAATSGIASAHSTVSFGISLGVPIVGAPVYVAPPPVVYAPPPVYYAPPRVYYAPAYYAPPRVVVRYRPHHAHRHHW